MHALNGSGRSPLALTLDIARRDGVDFTSNPYDIHSVTVPGAAAGWVDSIDAWGSMPLSSVLAPAITLAREGFPVSDVTAYAWNKGTPLLKLGPHGGVRVQAVVTPSAVLTQKAMVTILMLLLCALHV